MLDNKVLNISYLLITVDFIQLVYNYNLVFNFSIIIDYIIVRNLEFINSFQNIQPFVL